MITEKPCSTGQVITVFSKSLKYVYLIFVAASRDFNFKLILIHQICFQHSDMNEEMRTEAMELCVTACEKFSTNNEVFVILFTSLVFSNVGILLVSIFSLL